MSDVNPPGSCCPYCSTALQRSKHCPNCLRAVHKKRRDGFHCGGILEPVSTAFSGAKCFINYKCSDCAEKSKQASSVNDRFRKIAEVAIRAEQR